MGDSTQFLVTVEGGSEDLRERLEDRCEYHLWGSPFGDGLRIEGDDWVEGSCGAGSELQGAFDKVLEGFLCQDWPTRISIIEEGKYEWNGSLYRWRPHLGWHEVEIDHDSSVIVEAQWLRDRIDEAESLDALRAIVDEKVGAAWEAD